MGLRTEVKQLTSHVKERDLRLERQWDLFCTTVGDLERQLQSVAIGYDQVEQKAAAFARENRELNIASQQQKPVSQGVTCDAADRAGFERAAALSHQKIEDQQAEIADLRDILGRVAAACPDVAAFVAPLTEISSRGA